MHAPADGLALLEKFPGRRILLVGDFMLDRYVFGDAERISPEAPVPVLRVIERQDGVGPGRGHILQALAPADIYARARRAGTSAPTQQFVEWNAGHISQPRSSGRGAEAARRDPGVESPRAGAAWPPGRR